MNSLLFILNPAAGGGRTRKLIPLIEDTMKKHNIEYEVRITNKPKEATKIVEESSHHKVIAVGGDGTVNEVAKGIINRGFGILGIIPSGTGNDLSRSLGIPLDPLKAIESIIKGKTKEIDIGMANEYQFLNIASFGLDAEVVVATNKIKTKIRGKIAYLLGVFLILINYKKKDVLIEIDGKEYKEKLVLLAVGNGKYYGGGLPILPSSQLSDGYLHLCLVKDISNLLILFLFPSIFKGAHYRFKKYVMIFKAKNVKIKSKEDMYYNVDGEIIYGGQILNFKLYDDKLSIIYSE